MGGKAGNCPRAIENYKRHGPSLALSSACGERSLVGSPRLRRLCTGRTPRPGAQLAARADTARRLRVSAHLGPGSETSHRVCRSLGPSKTGGKPVFLPTLPDLFQAPPASHPAHRTERSLGSCLVGFRDRASSPAAPGCSNETSPPKANAFACSGRSTPGLLSRKVH